MDLKSTTEPVRRSAASASAINLAVINAILLRDIKARAGAYYTGFLMFLLMPLVHLLLLVIIYNIVGRVAPVGNDPVVYYGVSVLPFVIYMYVARQVILALPTNRPLLYFSRIKIFDILFARGALEAVNSVVVVIVLLFILICFSNGFAPRDWPGFVFAIVGCIYLGFCVGVVNGLIAHVFPPWFIVFNISIPVAYASSGVIFFPSTIPHPYDQWVAFNPLLQCVEWIRYSYYEAYPDNLLNIPYLLSFATACLAISLLGEKFMRQIFLSK